MRPLYSFPRGPLWCLSVPWRTPLTCNAQLAVFPGNRDFLSEVLAGSQPQRRAPWGEERLCGPSPLPSEFSAEAFTLDTGGSRCQGTQDVASLRATFPSTALGKPHPSDPLPGAWSQLLLSSGGQLGVRQACRFQWEGAEIVGAT